MTEGQVVPTENVPSDVSDEQVDKYFESNGEVELETKETPKEEKKEEVKEPPKEEKKETMVPHAALHEERMKRKQIQEEMAALKTKTQRMEQLFQQLQQPEQKLPEFNENPAEHLRLSLEDQRKKAEQFEQFIQQQQQTAQHSARIHKVVSTYHQAASEFSKKQEDFADAYKYVIENRVSEYLAAGYSQEQANEFIYQDELAIVEKALADEANPAERVYKIAQARGYKAKAKEPPKDSKLEQVEKGLTNGKSLGAVSGKGGDTMTLEQLADLEGDEFDKAWEKLIVGKK